jgi:hypothetical protein
MKLPLQHGIWPALFVALNGQAVRAAPALVPASMPNPSSFAAGAVPRLETRAFAPLECAFQIPDLAGDPFDFVANDVRVRLRLPDGRTLSLPAFFDGGATWRVRHTPSAPGRYEVVSISRNGQSVNTLASPRRWKVNGNTLAGFVRLDARNPRRFVRDGARYFPLGHNQAWQSGGLPDIPVLFGKMGAAGENWSRVWMNHWDGKNLDWLPDGKTPGPLGTLSLDVARRWDAIVNAAQTNGIAFQLVFQHHGQYSSEVNPNWNDNPYNIKNGGFLKTPEEFFSDARAKELTRRKLRYTVARWGYSPSILAWELWNEVQFSDAARHGQWDAVAAWHEEMAAFLRSQDAYGHLITSSASGALPVKVQQTLDFYQEHLYPADVMNALHEGQTRADLPRGKPFFVGEFGPPSVQDPTGVALHAGLWAGILSNEAGAPGFWTWDDVERHDLYGHFRAAADFVKESDLPARDGLIKSAPVVATAQKGDLSFGPGADWGQQTQNEFVVLPDGPPSGIGTLPRYLQGQGNRTLGPKPLQFHVAFPQSGRFSVQLGQIAKRGAHLKLALDGAPVAERDFPASEQDYPPQGEQSRLFVEVPVGEHVVTVENTGNDWATIERFSLSNYAPGLGSFALSRPDYFAAWIYHRANVLAAPGSEAPPVAGQLMLPRLKAGFYRATWWDTRAGKALGSSDLSVGARPASLLTPSVARDVALFVAPRAVATALAPAQ